ISEENKSNKLKFKSLSSITELPDAQRIFGAVCSIIRFTQGDEQLKEYLNSFDQEPKFVHSSMFVDGLYPMPKISLFSVKERNQSVVGLEAQEQLQYLSKQKQIKKIRYITSDVFEKYINCDRISDLKADLLKENVMVGSGVLSSVKFETGYDSQLIAHNNRSTNADELRLFYDSNTYYPQDTVFTVYVKTNTPQYVRDVFKYSEYFGFGSRVSVGKNCFTMVEMEEYSSSDPVSNVVLMSKCISHDEFELTESSYVIDSHSFISSKYYKSSSLGIFNAFTEGSFMKPLEKKEYYGCLVKCNDEMNIYHYGIGFVM
ncbi:MAG: hypothetical protein HUJ58_01265, partial [Erysipelotrichaceae bacterium]|nr:hypothetical protein [Erysipelotrichaceae bacterium]